MYIVEVCINHWEYNMEQDIFRQEDICKQEISLLMNNIISRLIINILKRW